jgi:hypothetical protein
LYHHNNKLTFTILAIYVDDIVFGRDNKEELVSTLMQLLNMLTVNILGELNLFLWIIIIENETAIVMNQRLYIDCLGEKFLESKKYKEENQLIPTTTLRKRNKETEPLAD